MYIQNNSFAVVFSTKVRKGCQVVENLLFDPFIEHWCFSNCMLYMTYLIQCLYVRGEESFHLHKFSLLARGEQKAIASDYSS